MSVAEPTKMRNLRYPVRLREKRMARILKPRSKFLFVIGMVGLSAFCLMPGLAHPQGNASNEPQNIIAFLNQTLAWYRQVNAQQQAATEPSDVVLFNQNRQLADEVVRLSFEFARA